MQARDSLGQHGASIGSGVSPPAKPQPCLAWQRLIDCRGHSVGFVGKTRPAGLVVHVAPNGANATGVGTSPLQPAGPRRGLGDTQGSGKEGINSFQPTLTLPHVHRPFKVTQAPCFGQSILPGISCPHNMGQTHGDKAKLVCWPEKNSGATSKRQGMWRCYPDPNQRQHP